MSEKSKPIVSTNMNNFIEHGGIAIATHDQFMKIEWCNNAFIDMFKSSEDLIGKTLFDLCPREVDRVSRFVSKFREGTSPTVSTSLHMRTGDGVNRYIVINSEKFLSKDGTIEEIISYFRDDTKRMIREDRVKTALESSSQVYKHRGLFISKIVHELRTPIAELMMIIGKQDAGMPHALALSRQIKNMTYATKFEMGEFIVPTEEKCSLQDILDISVNSSKIGITTDIVAMISCVVLVDSESTEGDGDGPVTVNIDETLVCTVLSELIRNSCQLKNVMIKVTVDYNTSTQHSTFKVEDNGPGMELSWILRIFQDFWGEHSKQNPTDIVDSMTKDVPGMGIGLNICYNIIQCMNSTLEVKTSSSGTIFWFVIETPMVDNQESMRNKHTYSDILYNWSKMNSVDQEECPDEADMPTQKYEYDRTIDPDVKKKSSFVDKFKGMFSNSKSVKPDTNDVSQDATSDSHMSKEGNPSESENHSEVSLSKRIKNSRTSVKSSVNSNSKSSHVNSKSRKSSRKSSRGVFRQEGSLCTGDGFQSHVLVVDDNTIVRKLCGRILSNIGCTFDTAENGALAVNKVKSHHEYYYDMILMDLRMPLMNGLDAARIIVEDLNLTIPIVAFTAEDSIDVFKEALDCGMVGFLHKPATQTNIEHIVDKYSRRM